MKLQALSTITSSFTASDKMPVLAYFAWHPDGYSFGLNANPFLTSLTQLGDKQIEYQILDRISFKKFLCIETGDKVSDEKTVWLFRETVTNTGLVEELFVQFKKYLESKELIFNEGQLVDASFTIAPRQRNTREENEKIKKGEGDDLWNDEPHKKCHKDIDARWTKKNEFLDAIIKKKVFYICS